MIDIDSACATFIDFIYSRSAGILPDNVRIVLETYAARHPNRCTRFDLRATLRLLIYRERFRPHDGENLPDDLQEIYENAHWLSRNNMSTDVHQWLQLYTGNMQILRADLNNGFHNQNINISKMLDGKKRGILDNMINIVGAAPVDAATRDIYLEKLHACDTENHAKPVATRPEPTPAITATRTRTPTETTAKRAKSSSGTTPSDGQIKKYCLAHGYIDDTRRCNAKSISRGLFLFDLEPEKILGGWSLILKYDDHVTVLRIPANTFTTADFYNWPDPDGMKLSLGIHPTTLFDRHSRSPRNHDLGRYRVADIYYHEI